MAINRSQQGATKVARRPSPASSLTQESRRVHQEQRQAVVLPEYATLQIARDDQALPLPSGVGAGALVARVPDGAPLSVTRYAASGKSVEATPGVTTLSTGELGLQTPPTPGTALTLAGTLEITGAARLAMTREDNVNLMINPILYASTAARLVSIQAQRAGGTAASPQATTATTTFLRLIGKGHDGTAFPSLARTWIDLAAAEAWTPTTQGSRITFNTTLSGTTTQGERLRIDGNGYVGIAHSAPQFPLHVGGALACGVPASAPVDANLGNGEMTIWLNGTTLTFRVKDSGGVLRTGTLALT